MTDERRRSPLAHRVPLASNGETATLAERPFMGLLALRGEPDTVAPTVQQATSCELPREAGRSTMCDEASVLWLGPDEWLIVTEPGRENDIRAAIAGALADTHHQIVDVTDYYTTIAIGGIHARELLSKLAIIDLHPRHFGKGDAVASIFAKATGWLQMLDDENADSGPAFALIVRRSMADYLWCLLAEAGREWGLPAQEPIGQVKLHLPHFEDETAPA